MDLLILLRDAEGGAVGFLRAGVRVLAQALMEVEVAGQIGAEHGDRAPDRRTARRNGVRERDGDTRAGTVDWRSLGGAAAATPVDPGGRTRGVGAPTSAAPSASRSS